VGARDELPTTRNLVSAALADLDGPLERRADRVLSDRDLADPEVWDISLARVRAKRRAPEPTLLPQARVAGASLLVAAVAAALPVQSGAHSRARTSGVTRAHVELLRFGSRGPAVAEVQRALGIDADGIFGPRTRAAVRSFQQRHDLLVDGVVGPQTRAALARVRGGQQGGEERRIFLLEACPERRPATVGGAGARAKNGLTLWSAYRPGSRFPGGKRSDHSYYPSKAIDVAASARSMRRYARAVAGMPGVDIVIHSPVGIWQAGVGWSEIHSSTTRREHYDHVHVDTF